MLQIFIYYLFIISYILNFFIRFHVNLATDSAIYAVDVILPNFIRIQMFR